MTENGQSITNIKTILIPNEIMEFSIVRKGTIPTSPPE